MAFVANIPNDDVQIDAYSRLTSVLSHLRNIQGLITIYEEGYKRYATHIPFFKVAYDAIPEKKKSWKQSMVRKASRRKRPRSSSSMAVCSIWPILSSLQSISAGPKTLSSRPKPSFVRHLLAVCYLVVKCQAAPLQMSTASL